MNKSTFFSKKYLRNDQIPLQGCPWYIKQVVSSHSLTYSPGRAGGAPRSYAWYSNQIQVIPLGYGLFLSPAAFITNLHVSSLRNISQLSFQSQQRLSESGNNNSSSHLLQTYQWPGAMLFHLDLTTIPYIRNSASPTI